HSAHCKITFNDKRNRSINSSSKTKGLALSARGPFEEIRNGFQVWTGNPNIFERNFCIMAYRPHGEQSRKPAPEPESPESIDEIVFKKLRQHGIDHLHNTFCAEAEYAQNDCHRIALDQIYSALRDRYLRLALHMQRARLEQEREQE